MKAIEILHDEHLSMAAMFGALNQLLDGIAAKKMAPDYQLLAAMLDYLIREPEQLHHPKEDQYLFPALLRRDEDSRALLEKLEHEHSEGQIRVKDLANAFIRYQSQGDIAFKVFEDKVRMYTHYGLRHISLEERELLPALRAKLTSEDWQEIDREFETNMTGVNGEFRSLFTKVVHKLPAPLGVGGSST